MTAALTRKLDDPRDTDADLVRGSMAGDRTAFAQIYDRYADRLHDFCVRMLRDHDGAADCVQEAFCVAATRLPQLREPDKLRPWLYAIARNEALARLRERRRETPFDELPDIESHDATPDKVAARTELADLIARAAGGLSDRDRVVFDLAFHHGLSGADLADALEISHANANKIVSRLRRTIERSLGALLLSRRAEGAPGGCTELGEILAGWDGRLTVLMRKRISRHVESCARCDDEHRRLVNPTALLGTTPIFIAAPDSLRERTLGEVQLTCHGTAMASESDDAGHLFATDPDGADAQPASVDAGARRRDRRWLWAAVWLMAVLGASAGLTFAWSNQAPMSITTAEVNRTGPAPNGQTPTPGNLLPTPITLHTTTGPGPIANLPPRAPVVQIPAEAPAPQGPVVQVPAEAPPPGPVVQTPAENPPPQVPVTPNFVTVTPDLNASPRPGRSSADMPAPGSERKPDARRSPAATRNGGGAPEMSRSLQSSSARGAPPSRPQTAMRPAPVSGSDPDPSSPTPRQSARDAGASDADSPGRRDTGP